VHAQLFSAARRLIPLCCIDRLEPDEQSDQLRWRDTGIVAAAAKRPVTFYGIHEKGLEHKQLCSLL
jgi:hypothetical protein